MIQIIIKLLIISNILKNFEIPSIINLKNNNILIGCCENTNFLIIENNNLIKIKSKENVHTGNIAGLFETDNGIIISYSADCTVKFFY